MEPANKSRKDMVKTETKLEELYRVVGYSRASYQEEGVGWMVCREKDGGGGVLEVVKL